MDCVFCGIAQKTIPSTLIFENDDIVAFHDQHPQAPIHVLLIPKRHIATVNEANAGDALLLGQLIVTAQQIATQLGIAQDGYRLVFNVNPHGGQTVYHIHLHLLGGRHMTWPPG